MNEILIYGLPAGENRPYMEALLSTQCKTRADVDGILNKAKAAGYHSFRIANYDGAPPDFIKAINI
jgi:hypothetical protein